MNFSKKNHEHLNGNSRNVSKTTMKFLASGLMVLTLMITSCSKDSAAGDIGPIGPKGEQGIQGEKGEPGTNGTDGQDGENGQDGEDGNANVIVSEWIEPIESSYTLNLARNKSLELASGISQSIIDGGVILVYYDNDIEVKLLPYYLFYPTGSIYSPGNIRKSIEAEVNHATRKLYVNIRAYFEDLTPREYLWDPSGAAYAKGTRFRYVIIPNTTSGKTSSIDFKKMTYKEVIDHFGFDY